MPRAYRLQSNFTKGVLDPRLTARTDVDAYYNGVFQGDNVIPLVQGGLARRPGFEYFAGLGTSKCRVIPFQFNVEQEYIIVLRNLDLQVYKDGVLLTTVVTPWPEAILFEIDFTQSADTMILVHEDYEPRKLVRGVNEAIWTLSILDLINIPQFYYNDANSPASTDEIQRIDFGAGINNGEDFQITLEGVSSAPITYPEADKQEVARLIQNALLGLSNTPSTGITVTFVSAEIYEVTFSGPAADSWPLMIVQEVNTGSGLATVTRIQAGVPGTEDIISAVRGWPKTVTFHEARLWFGGLKQLPQTILASRIADFFNLDLGNGLDDEAIQVTIDTDQVNAIQNLYSGRQLQVFTSGGEFIVPTVENRPITPGTIAIRRQTQHGSSKVSPVSIDGRTMFLERSGKVLRDFVYGIEEDGFSAPMLSLLSSDLIRQPVDMAAQRGTANEQSNYVYIVNADGKVTVFNVLREQNIGAFTNWEITNGLVESVAVLEDRAWFVVNRSGTRYLEALNDQLRFDFGKFGDSYLGNTASGFDHLEGQSVRSVADGFVQQAQTVTGGDLVYEYEPSEVQAGYDFNPVIVTMPLNIDFGNGPTLTRRKRFVEATVNVFESLGVIIEGKRVPDRKFGENVLDQAATPQTGIKQAYVHGWTDTAQLTITQTDPLPMTITGVVIEVELV